MKQSDGTRRPDRLARNSLGEKLRSEHTVVGTFLEIGAPAVIEVLGLAGFDFVVVDREHGAIDLQTTEQLIRAGCSTDISVMVRTPRCEDTEIARPLDMGAAGVHVPRVEDATAARAAVAASKYHPLGQRGLQPYVRAASYRACPTADYLATANQDTVLVIHVEGVTGIANLEAILQVEGVDVVFIGPYDLSQSLGVPGQVRDSRVEDAMRQAIELARAEGKRIGTYCDDAETALAYRAMGVSYLTISIDANMLLTAARSITSQFQKHPAAVRASH